MLLVCSYNLTTLLLGTREGWDQALETRNKVFTLFFCCCCCFGCFRQPPLEMGEKIGYGEVACFLPVLLPGTRSSCSGKLPRLLLIGCHWQNGLCHRQYTPLVPASCVYSCVSPAKSRRQRCGGRQQQQHEGPTSSSNPQQTLSGLLNRNNGITSSTVAAFRPRKIARVVTHDYRS